MEGRIVSRSFLTAPREILAGQLALLEGATLGNLIWSKAADLLDAEKGEFNRRVSESAQSLMKESSGELVLRLLGALNSVLGIQPRRYETPRDFEDNCEEILDSCLAVLRETEPQFSGTTLQEMLRFLMNKMFGEIGRRFESLSVDEQQKVVDAVRNFINELPEVQRERLRAEIGADQITDSYIRKAIVSGTLSTVFAGAVSVGGFAFYTGAVSLLASVAGLVGITLPFSAYVGLTSTIAVVSNPLFFIPVITGGGVWLYKRQNRKMRCRLAPLVVAQLALTYLAKPNYDADHSEGALQLWQSAWAKVEDARRAEAGAEIVLSNTQAELRRTNEWIRVLKQRREEHASDLRKVHAEVRSLCISSAGDIAAGRWGAGVKGRGQELKSYLDAIERCRTRQSNGLFDGIGRTFAILEAKGNAKISADRLASAVIAYNGDRATMPAWVQELLRRHCEIKRKEEELELELSQSRELKAALERLAEAERARLRDCQAKRRCAESRYWGLSEIR